MPRLLDIDQFRLRDVLVDIFRFGRYSSDIFSAHHHQGRAMDTAQFPVYAVAPDHPVHRPYDALVVRPQEALHQVALISPGRIVQERFTEHDLHHPGCHDVHPE